MAVADYFGRNALAVAQAISGLDEKRLADVLANVRVGVVIGRDAACYEGQSLVDLLVRLLARLYPTLIFSAEGDKSIATAAAKLAARINPRIDLTGEPTVEIVIGGPPARRGAPLRIFVGSDGWTANISTSRPQSCGDTNVPFGPGIAACLAAGNLFRHVFLSNACLDSDATFEVPGSNKVPRRTIDWRGSSANMVLAGAGAIGNAAAWALARSPLRGAIGIVDHEIVDLGNLQRYVLAERSDEGAPKPLVAARYFGGLLTATPYETDLAKFLEAQNHRVDRLLLALDSARDRRIAQASLPRWLANAWTQPGDVGLSTHDFLNGACVSCLYLPDGALQNEDAIIAEAFGVPGKLMQIRTLLYVNGGAPRDLLEAIASARAVPIDRLVPFEGRPVRDLYVEGFCGGAVIPLSQIGAPRTDVHVPLAHQSALAGVLLGAATALDVLAGSKGSHITQVDVLKPLPTSLIRPAAKDPRGMCICQDPDYRDVYAEKYGNSMTLAEKGRTRAKARPVARRRKGAIANARSRS